MSSYILAASLLQGMEEDRDEREFVPHLRNSQFNH